MCIRYLLVVLLICASCSFKEEVKGPKGDGNVPWPYVSVKVKNNESKILDLGLHLKPETSKSFEAQRVIPFLKAFEGELEVQVPGNDSRNKENILVTYEDLQKKEDIPIIKTSSAKNVQNIRIKTKKIRPLGIFSLTLRVGDSSYKILFETVNSELKRAHTPFYDESIYHELLQSYVVSGKEIRLLNLIEIENPYLFDLKVSFNSLLDISLLTHYQHLSSDYGNCGHLEKEDKTLAHGRALVVLNPVKGAPKKLTNTFNKVTITPGKKITLGLYALNHSIKHLIDNPPIKSNQHIKRCKRGDKLVGTKRSPIFITGSKEAFTFSLNDIKAQPLTEEILKAESLVVAP